MQATDLDSVGLEGMASGDFEGDVAALRHGATSQHDWREVFGAVRETGRLDVPVNSADIMLAGSFEDAPRDAPPLFPSAPRSLASRAAGR